MPQINPIETETELVILYEEPEFLITDLTTNVGHRQGIHHYMNPAYRVNNDGYDLAGELGFASLPIAADSRNVNLNKKVIVNGDGFVSNYTKQYSVKSKLDKPFLAIGRWLVMTPDEELRLLIVSYLVTNGQVETGQGGVAILVPVEGRPMLNADEYEYGEN
ncbi:hypothetical protein, partial [Brevibacillus sp. MCWH]|uniref:hypothetical protein n=1 Tax=Brevibacillus sp. MCWH TaxID=2508871 RepID=UPI00149231C3